MGEKERERERERRESELERETEKETETERERKRKRERGRTERLQRRRSHSHLLLRRVVFEETLVNCAGAVVRSALNERFCLCLPDAPAFVRQHVDIWLGES